jgi:hypothetical protein
VSIGVLQGCSGGSVQAGDASAENVEASQADGSPVAQTSAYVHPCDAGGRSYAPTYDAVWNEILHSNCAVEFCHGGSADYLQLPSESAGYIALVGVPAEGPLCAPTGLVRVAPFHPDASLLYLKVTDPPCGAKMPFGVGNLCPADIDQIARWIACGAPNGDAGCEDGAADE